ncbi:MAG: energy transducer TonB [Gammaproteobacteria bacterium]
MKSNIQSKKPQRNFWNRFQIIIIFVVALISSHGAVAQPQINFEMIKGDVVLDSNAEPRYPTRALDRGIVGWIEVSFEIDTNGEVINYSIDIVDAAPRGMFDSATIRAVQTFLFTPSTLNGVPSIVTNVQYRFEYSL